MAVTTMRIKTKTVRITIIVASSALPMVPNARFEIYILGSKKEMRMTTTIMTGVMMLTMRMMIRMISAMITIIVASFALPMLYRSTLCVTTGAQRYKQNANRIRKETRMTMTMMTMRMRMMPVTIAIIVSSSALPMLPQNR